jgi:hypothetical protein
MLGQRLTILLLALLALLQGMVPLLHAHADGSSVGEPHFHVSLRATGDLGFHPVGPDLRSHSEIVIEAAGGLSRGESFTLIDEPVVAAGPDAWRASAAYILVRSPESFVTLPGLAAFSRPPSRAPPLA